MDYRRIYRYDIDANFPCVFRRFPTKFLALSAERRLRSAAAAMRQRSLHETAQPPLQMRICCRVWHCLQPFLHRCTWAAASLRRLSTLLRHLTPWAAQRVEQAERLACGAQ